MADKIKAADRKAKELHRDKFYYAVGHSFQQTNNPLPPEYENRIICADCLEVLKKLPDNCIDIIFTSPPYNFGLDYDTNDDVDDPSKPLSHASLIKRFVESVADGSHVTP